MRNPQTLFACLLGVCLLTGFGCASDDPGTQGDPARPDARPAAGIPVSTEGAAGRSGGMVDDSGFSDVHEVPHNGAPVD